MDWEREGEQSPCTGLSQSDRPVTAQRMAPLLGWVNRSGQTHPLSQGAAGWISKSSAGTWRHCLDVGVSAPSPLFVLSCCLFLLRPKLPLPFLQWALYLTTWSHRGALLWSQPGSEMGKIHLLPWHFQQNGFRAVSRHWVTISLLPCCNHPAVNKEADDQKAGSHQDST